jgi:single-strand DNA-binding protein
MASFNKVFLIGNLTRDPELRYLPSGMAVAEFGLATNRQYRDRSGTMQQETCFVDITVWGRQGEICNQYLSKGRPVFIEGRLKYDAWDAPDGGRRSKLRVVAERFQFLGGPGGPGGADTRPVEQQRAPEQKAYGPNTQSYGGEGNSYAMTSASQKMGLSDEEIPF